LELTTIIGLGAGAFFIVYSIIMGGPLSDFWDPASVLIVVGGVLASTVVAYRGKSLKMLKSIYTRAFKKIDLDLNKDIEMIISIANVARREGLLALEDTMSEIDNPFLKKGIMLIVDGTDTELIKNILETEVYFIQSRHAEGQAMVNTMAGYAPAYGMIGTLIGLIQMLQNLDDSSTLGAGMATALITTFYGCILANLVFGPIAKKLKQQSDIEALQMELYIEGLLSIQEGENPRIIRDKLNAFIARREIKAAKDKGAEAVPEVQEIESERQKEI
jgi:chemotaxis protein MotA